MKGRVLVVGGGVGGLAAACALARSGATVSVHERREEFVVEGGVVSLQENALRALDVLGAADEVSRNGVAVPRTLVRDHRDRPHIPAEFYANVGRHYMATRHALHRALLGAAQRAGVEIHTGSRVLDARRDGSITLEGGQELSADLIVGADGIGSRVRRGASVRCRIVRMGYREGGAVIHIDLPPSLVGEVRSRWSGSKRILYTPLGEGIAFAGFGGRTRDFPDTGVHPLATDAWKRSFPEEIDARIVRQIAVEALPAVPISTVICSRWSDGRLVLIGDAAHAMPPNRGQGAAIAMQDGVLLAQAIGQLDGLSDLTVLSRALASWEAGARPVIRGTQRGAMIFCVAQSRWPRAALALRPAFFRAWSRTQRPDLRLLPSTPMRPS